MSFKFKFTITIISLIIIVVLGISITSKGERYVTVEDFINNISEYELGDYFKIRGKINYSSHPNVGLDSLLYIDESQTTAIFNLYDSNKIVQDSNFIQVLYVESSKAELFGPSIINKEALVSGRYLKDTIIQYNGRSLKLKNLLISDKMQTKCDSKYEEN